MLYHILYPLVKYWTGFNVFQYITFRGIGAFITATVLCLIFTPRFIRRLKKYQVVESIDGSLPESHRRKAGTPTMGGIILILMIVISSLLWNDLTNSYVLVAILVTLWLGGLGFLDDYLKNVKHKPGGMVEKYKLSGQIVLGLLIAFTLYFGYEDVNAITEISIPFLKDVQFSLGYFFIPLVALYISFYSNAINITDGLDGLASGSVAMVAFGLGLMAYIKGHFIFSDYLQLEFIPESGELAVYSAALMGAILGFLWFNVKPAEIFMGDTGALSVGGLLALISILIKEEIYFIIIGGLFLVEAGSSLLQRYYFKYTRKKMGTGKRLLLCAPLHHHLEFKGWAEEKIVVRFWIITVLLTAFGLITLKLR
jgi:phospho-N-acetylmuramoyl-pentapeptide-transferase